MTMNDKQWSLFRKIHTIYEYYPVSPYKTYNSRPIGFFFHLPKVKGFLVRSAPTYM